MNYKELFKVGETLVIVNNPSYPIENGRIVEVTHFSDHNMNVRTYGTNEFGGGNYTSTIFRKFSKLERALK